MTARTCRLPIKTVSVANLREHWSKRARRARQHRQVALLLVQAELASVRRWFVPVVVKLTRVAPRALDSDNLQSSCKAARDGVADALGIDDGDDSIRWEYDQIRGNPREYAVIVTVRDACED